MSVRSRLRAALVLSATLALAFSTLLVGSSSAGATTSSTYPYSDPVWFPVHVPVQVGCVGPGSASNGGRACATDHAGYFGINLDVARDSRGAYPSAGVYSAGAGRILRVVSSLGCTSGRGSAGNYVAVDHGGGVVSMYEHLRSIPVKAGQYVSAGQLLGYASNSGAPCSEKPYLDFVVRIDGGGYQDKTRAVNTLKACVRSGSATAVQTWPSALRGRYSSWIKVPYLGLTTPSAVTGCGQTAVPFTYGLPTLHRGTTPASPGKARILWNATHATSVEVQYEIWHPSTRAWGYPCSGLSSSCSVGFVNVGKGHTVLTVTGLLSKRLYRFHISRHNANGWSVWSGWLHLTAT